MFARAHILDDVKFRQSRVSPFEVLHKPRQYPGDAPAATQGAVGYRSHQPRAATAIDNCEAALGQKHAQTARSIMIIAMARLAGRGVNANDGLAFRVIHLVNPASAANGSHELSS